MIRLVSLEIMKVCRRPRTYLGYAGVLLLLVPFILMLRHVHPEDFIRHQVGSGFEVVGTFFNALFLARFMMQIPPILMFFIPLFVCAVAGDLVAGEAAEGTLRTLLVRPVGRAQVLLAKWVVAVLHCGAITFFLGAASLAAGALFFGLGDLFIFDQGVYVIPMREALLRIAGGYALAAVAMVAVASIALLLSVLVDNSIFAIGGAMVFLIVSGVLGLVPYFESIQPYLITTHMGLWQHLFADPIPWDEVRTAVAWLAGYTVVCLALALLLFRRKDILS